MFIRTPQPKWLHACILACVISHPEYDCDAILQRTNLAASISGEFERKEQDVA